MKRIGISIYPEKSTQKEIFDYIDVTSALGFKRIFTCLLSVNKPKEEIIEEFQAIHTYAKAKGFEITLDVSPSVFEKLSISYKDLSFFKLLHADGIRLDMGFGGSEESLMTFNPHDLLIEINMSNDTHYLETILDYQPNRNRLVGCHNFYPHGYSGLSLDYFNRCTKRFNKNGIQTAAFITSQKEGTFGPWPVTQGLPTLEMHRHLPIDIQLKHYVAMQTIDDVLISNCYPNKEELEKIGKVRLDLVNFNVQPINGLPEIETKIMFEELHFNRGDVSENLIRSTQPRVKYRGTHFALINTPDVIKRGDVIIESSEYGHYAGELQIALNDMKNSGKSNVVGHIVEEELFLLDYIKPWQKFVLTRAD